MCMMSSRWGVFWTVLRSGKKSKTKMSQNRRLVIICDAGSRGVRVAFHHREDVDEPQDDLMDVCGHNHRCAIALAICAMFIDE